tara:strand:- start:69 stop:242 length:174 start_codon:yes stop_codon:yes gene_type:complete
MKVFDHVKDEERGLCVILEMNDSKARICLLRPEAPAPYIPTQEWVSLEALGKMEVVA